MSHGIFLPVNKKVYIFICIRIAYQIYTLCSDTHKYI